MLRSLKSIDTKKAQAIKDYLEYELKELANPPTLAISSDTYGIPDTILQEVAAAHSLSDLSQESQRALYSKDFPLEVLSSDLRKEIDSLDLYKDILLAIVTQNTDAIANQVALGIDLNAKTNFTYSFLTFAVDNGVIDSVRELIKQGAQVSMPDEFGRTPLHYAVSRKDKPMVALLLEAGADPNLPDRKGTIPLMPHKAASLPHKYTTKN